MKGSRADDSRDGRFLDLAAHSLLQKLLNEDGSTGGILLSLKFIDSTDLYTSDKSIPADGIHILPKPIIGIEVSDGVVNEALDIYENIIGSRDGFMEKLEDTTMDDEGSNME